MKTPKMLFALAATSLLLAGGNTLAASTAAPAATPVNASANGGYYGPGPNITTVKQALDMKDDTPVALKGRIIRSLGKEKYLFQDETGTIPVEIDHDKWHGQHVTAEDTVEIQGEVDRDWKKTKIDVSRIVKIQSSRTSAAH